MQNSNRTSKVLTNAKISLFFFIILLFLNFVSRSVFIKYLGTDILGLNTIVTNLVGFLNLAELGISAAIGSSLYKPLSENNKNEIREIITIQGWLYRKIAYLIIIAAFFLMCFFPIIFQKINISLLYAYSIFSVLVISSLLTYFINYKQVLLIADMKEYKIIQSLKTIQIIKIILQIMAMIYLNNSFIYWVLLELIYGLSSSYLLKKIIDKEYAWLSVNVKSGKYFKIKYPNIIKSTKQLFFHKIAGFVLLQTTPLIIYAYVSLKMVTIYDNYMMIILGITNLVNAIFSSFQPGIGNLVANGNKKIILKFFEEYSSLRYWLASIFCVMFFYQGHRFITLWLGDQFILEKSSFIFLNIYMFITLTRVIDPFVYAYALYGDIYAPILEAIINLSLSMILGFYFGLPGILAGVVISLSIVVCLWRPFYVYSLGFNVGFSHYLRKNLLYFISIFFSVIIFNFTLSKIEFYGATTYIFFIKSIVMVLLYTFISLIIFCMFLPEFRKVILRVIKILKLNKFLKFGRS